MRELIDEFEYSLHMGTKGNDFVHYHVFARSNSVNPTKCLKPEPEPEPDYVTVDVLLLYLEEVFN